MAERVEYESELNQAFEQAKVLADDPAALAASKRGGVLSHPLKAEYEGAEVPLGKTVAEGIETIVGNLRQNKYLYSILLTALVEKLVNPTQDIRIAQTSQPGGYSNRSTDQTHVTPFLKAHALTSCAASGVESGRNFERPSPFTLRYVGKPQGKGNREAFLGVIHAVQEEGVDPRPCIALLMALDLLNKTDTRYIYPEPPAGMTVEEAFGLFGEHYRAANGKGKARLPVLAIQAIYQSLVPEIQRYRDAELLPVNRHTANDKGGWIGDIQINRVGRPFEGIEVKSGKKITAQMVLDLPNKFRGQAIDRYYLLSTEDEYVAKSDVKDIQQAIVTVRQGTGCQVIVNGLLRSLWYYLRVISDPSQFISHYSEQLVTDADVNAEHRALWNRMLKDRVDES